MSISGAFKSAHDTVKRMMKQYNKGSRDLTEEDAIERFRDNPSKFHEVVSICRSRVFDHSDHFKTGSHGDTTDIDYYKTNIDTYYVSDDNICIKCSKSISEYRSAWDKFELDSRCAASETLSLVSSEEALSAVKSWCGKRSYDVLHDIVEEKSSYVESGRLTGGDISKLKTMLLDRKTHENFEGHVKISKALSVFKGDLTGEERFVMRNYDSAKDKVSLEPHNIDDYTFLYRVKAKHKAMDETAKYYKKFAEEYFASLSGVTQSEEDAIKQYKDDPDSLHKVHYVCRNETYNGIMTDQGECKDWDADIYYVNNVGTWFKYTRSVHQTLERNYDTDETRPHDWHGDFDDRPDPSKIHMISREEAYSVVKSLPSDTDIPIEVVRSYNEFAEKQSLLMSKSGQHDDAAIADVKKGRLLSTGRELPSVSDGAAVDDLAIRK